MMGCDHERARVIDSRQYAGNPEVPEQVRRWRRYECRDCGLRFSTVEIVMGGQLAKRWAKDPSGALAKAMGVMTNGS